MWRKSIRNGYIKSDAGSHLTMRASHFPAGEGAIHAPATNRLEKGDLVSIPYEVFLVMLIG